MKFIFSVVLLALLIVPGSAQNRHAKQRTPRSSSVVAPLPDLPALPQIPKLPSLPVINQSVEPDAIERAFAVKAGGYAFLKWDVTESDHTFSGRFKAQGGSGNNIEVLIMDEDEFENFRNGNTAQTFYNSGRVTVGKFDVKLRRGVYYFVLNNNFSVFSSKAVQVTFYE